MTGPPILRSATRAGRRRRRALGGGVAAAGLALLVIVAPLSVATALSPPWKGVVAAPALYFYGYGCYKIHPTAPAWAPKSGKVSVGGQQSTANCPPWVQAYSRTSATYVYSEETLSVPIAPSPSTTWVNVSLHVNVTGAAYLSVPGACPLPVLNGTGAGSDACDLAAEIILLADANVYDNANGSYVYSYSDLYASVINLDRAEFISCLSYVCTPNYANYSASLWTNGSTTQTLAFGGGCTWVSAVEDFCNGTGSSGGPIGFVAGHHYSVLVTVLSVTLTEVELWTGTSSASILGSGAGHGVWLTGVSVQ